LNRPKALNALTTDMVAAIDRALASWVHEALSAVVLASTSAKAFCAGGDIRTIREHSLAGDAEASERFFASEYRLNARIAEYPVPVVSLIDGLCMGGGLGLSVHGGFRVVSSPNARSWRCPRPGSGSSRTSGRATSCRGCPERSACTWD
jgi:enoyl-CoA hydratase